MVLRFCSLALLAPLVSSLAFAGQSENPDDRAKVRSQIQMETDRFKIEVDRVSTSDLSALADRTADFYQKYLGKNPVKISDPDLAMVREETLSVFISIEHRVLANPRSLDHPDAAKGLAKEVINKALSLDAVDPTVRTVLQNELRTGISTALAAAKGDQSQEVHDKPASKPVVSVNSDEIVEFLNHRLPIGENSLAAGNGGLCEGAHETPEKAVYCFKDWGTRDYYKIGFEQTSSSSKKMNIAVYDPKLRVFEPTLDLTLTREMTGRKVVVQASSQVLTVLYPNPNAGTDEELLASAMRQFLMPEKDNPYKEVIEAMLKNQLDHLNMAILSKQQVRAPEIAAAAPAGAVGAEAAEIKR